MHLPRTCRSIVAPQFSIAFAARHRRQAAAGAVAACVEQMERRILLSAMPYTATDEPVSMGAPPPVVTTSPVTAVSATAAALGGSVNPEGSTTTDYFQYSTSPTFTPSIITSIGSGFSVPQGVAVDAAGDVFVAQPVRSTIEEILPNGVIQSIGSGFGGPDAVAVDAAGDVFVADGADSTVDEILPNGTVLTIASGFSYPAGVAVDTAGDVFVSDYTAGAIDEVLPNGTVLTISTAIPTPIGVAVDASGDIFVAANGANQIEEILPNGAVLAIGSNFNEPDGVAVDAAGDVFVADTGNSTVDEVLPNNTIVTFGSVGDPNGIAVDAAGDVFVSDQNKTQIIEFSPPTIAANPSPVSGSSTIPISATVGGLAPNTTYYFRAVAAGPGGTVAAQADSFATAKPPAVSTSPATSISSTGATLNGSVNANGLSATTEFEYSPSAMFTPTVTSTIGSGFNNVTGVAVDAVGDVFVAQLDEPSITEVLPNGTMLTIGSGFPEPLGVAVNAAGDVFVADGQSTAIFEILPNGTTLTIGSGFDDPDGVAVDAAGDVFVADSDHNAVKEILPDGTIQSIGSGFNGPGGIAVDGAGDVFVTTYGSDIVEEVLANGTVITLGSGFSEPDSVAVDSAGDVFVVDEGNPALAVREILPNNTVVILGSGFVNSPQGIAVDAAGDLFVGDSDRLFKISPPTIPAMPSPVTGSSSTPISATLGGLSSDTLYYYRAVAVSAAGTVAAQASSFLTEPPPVVSTTAASSISASGATLNGTVNAEGSTTTARFQVSTSPTFAPTVTTSIGSGFSQPFGVAVDAAGDVFVADNSGTIDEILPNKTVLTIGSGFDEPTGVAVDAAGDVFVASESSVIAEILPNHTVLSIGSGFGQPIGVAVDAAGDVFVADNTMLLEEVLPSGKVLTIGSGFGDTFGVAVDGAGDLFVADEDSSSIDEVLPNGTILTIGSGFSEPRGVAVDAAGDVFVADSRNNAVKEVLPNGTILTLGSGFSGPFSVAVDAAGDVFVADPGNKRVVELSPQTLAASPLSLSGSSATAISAALSGLSSGTTYYYRAVAASPGGTVVGNTISFLAQSTLAISTTAEPTTAAVGTSIADKATLTGGNSPSGNVTFRLYSNSTASGTPLFTDTATLSGGSATSTGYTTTATGTDYWVDTYNGNGNNTAITSGSSSEPVKITTATPSISTTAQPATATEGTSIADKATVSGGDSPSGNVTFKLYSNSTASGTPLFTDTETLSGGTATSKGYTTTATGTDYWVDTYNGDSNNTSATSGNTSEPVTITLPPVGQFIGTASSNTTGSWNNLGNTYVNAFDFNTNTFFDAPTANGNWVQLDLGSAKTITKLAYAPRTTGGGSIAYEARMVNGYFEASNDPNFGSNSTIVTLYTIKTPPADGLTTQNISISGTYRYVRYVSPSGSFGNIAEMQIFGPGGTVSPVPPLKQINGTASSNTTGSYNGSGNTYAKAFDNNTSTFFDAPTANGNYVQLDMGSAQTITQIDYAPRPGFEGRLVGGYFEASNTSSFPSNSTTVLYTITAAPSPSDGLVTIKLSGSTKYRYVRYVSPNGSYGDIAEFEVFGPS